MVAAAVVGGYVVTQQIKGTSDAADTSEGQDLSSIDTSGIPDMVLGAEDAPVTIIEYASFTCPHCANFHKTVFPQLKADYIDTGKVRFIYREVFFDRFGLWAALVARCGGEAKYFGIADIVYDEQRDWLSGAEPKDIAANLRVIGKRAGLTEDDLEACLSDADNAQTLLARYEQQSKADEINSTPTFIIDGEKFNNMPYDKMREILDDKLNG